MDAKVVYQLWNVYRHQVFTRDAHRHGRTHTRTHTPVISEGQWVEFDQFSGKIWEKNTLICENTERDDPNIITAVLKQ